MTNARSTKRALWSSTVALFLCFAMLLGTTYAWFTDSVTSANNIIQSGNLDVELYYQVEGQTDWTKVTADTNVFMEDALWEPGHTEVVKLKVVNEGSLALKYTLGVNIADETGSVNAAGQTFLLSDYIKFGIVEGAQTYTRDEAIAAVDATANALNTAWNSGSAKLLPLTDGNADNEDVVTMVVYMPTTVGNEANHAKGAAVPTIKLGINLLATQADYESDSFGADYDADAITFVATPAEAQAALDDAAAGDIIQLAPGVDYGTLYLRPYDGGAATKTVDWIGNNYGWETYTLFENVTILGAEGATVDAIEIEGGTYYYTEHSQADAYPVMLSLVELKNVVIDGVTFTGKGGYDPQGYGNVINLAGGNIKVDGLTLKNCVLDNATNDARLIYKTESTTHVHTYAYEDETYTFSPTLKNITVTGCTFNGGYMGMELRETENLTITNNVFNVADRNILLPVNTGCTYTGNITITGNISNNAQERFVRGDGMGDAVVVIKDNVLNNYMGEDTDYIKVTNANNVTIENNPMTRAYKATNENELKAAVTAAQNGETVILAADITLTSELAIANKSVNIDGNGKKITFASSSAQGIAINSYSGGISVVEIRNATITGHNTVGSYASAIAVSGSVSELTLTNCTFIGNSGDYVVRADGAELTVVDCVFTANTAKNIVASGVNGKSNTVVIKDSVFEKNTIAGASVVYLKEGSSVAEGTATVLNCKFIENTVNSTTHAAVLYCDTTTVTGNEFTGNVVNAADARVGVIVLDAGAVTDNSFTANTIGTSASGTVYQATVVSKGDPGTELVLSNNGTADYANVKGNTVTVE